MALFCMALGMNKVEADGTVSADQRAMPSRFSRQSALLLAMRVKVHSSTGKAMRGLAKVKRGLKPTRLKNPTMQPPAEQPWQHEAAAPLPAAKHVPRTCSLGILRGGSKASSARYLHDMEEPSLNVAVAVTSNVSSKDGVDDDDPELGVGIAPGASKPLRGATVALERARQRAHEVAAEGQLTAESTASSHAVSRNVDFPSTPSFEEKDGVDGEYSKEHMLVQMFGDSRRQCRTLLPMPNT